MLMCFHFLAVAAKKALVSLDMMNSRTTIVVQCGVRYGCLQLGPKETDLYQNYCWWCSVDLRRLRSKVLLSLL
jgi:hypothetical protein